MIDKLKKHKRKFYLTFLVLLITFSLIQCKRANDVHGNYYRVYYNTGMENLTKGVLVDLKVTADNSSRAWFSNKVTVDGVEYYYKHLIYGNRHQKILKGVEGRYPDVYSREYTD